MSNWYATGNKAAEYAEKQQKSKKGGAFRFWMKQDTSTKIIFLDDFLATREVTLPSGEKSQIRATPFIIDEHQITMNGDFNNYKTCIAKMGPCPLCMAGHKSYTVGYFTVLSQWKDDEGVNHWNKKLYPAKLGALNLIRTQAELREDGQLQYAVLQINRSGDKAFKTGNDFNFMEYAPVEKIYEICPKREDEAKANISPFDYPAILKPDSLKELNILISSGIVAAPRTYGNSGNSSNNSHDSSSNSNDLGGGGESTEHTSAIDY